MAIGNDAEFQQWIQENNLSENDMMYIQRTVRNRTLVWWIISSIFGPIGIFIPFFVKSWSWYKIIKQRTFHPRQGFFYSLYCLAMVISFIMIIPAIIFFAINKTYSAGVKGLLKKGLIGDGEQSIVRRQQWENICKRSRMIRLLISAIATAGIFVLIILANNVDMTKVIEAVLTWFLFFDVIGLIICHIVNNIRYKRLQKKY